MPISRLETSARGTGQSSGQHPELVTDDEQLEHIMLPGLDPPTRDHVADPAFVGVRRSERPLR
jgi:hypothetical protein